MIDLHSTVNLRKIAVRNELRRLVTDTNLETSWAPVDELDGALGLDASNSAVHLLRDDVSTVQQAGGHVFAVARVTLDHLVVRLEAGVRDLLNGVGLVKGLASRDNRSIGHEREVDTRVRNQVGLELVEIDVERTIETERGSDGGDDYNSLDLIQCCKRWYQTNLERSSG